MRKKKKEVPPGSDWEYVLLHDRLGAGKENFDKEGIKAIFGTLATNYPETISEILMCNTNWIFWLFYHIAKLFIDPKTAQKIRILSNDTKKELLAYFDEKDLWHFYGGKMKWDYQVTAYYKLLGIPEPEPSKEEEEEAKKIKTQTLNEMD